MIEEVLRGIEAALDEEWLLFERDDDEDALRISFKSEGARYFAIAYRDDPTFVMIGSGWTLPDDVEFLQALRVANRLNARKKLVKVAIWEEERDVLFTIETLAATGDEIQQHIERVVDVLRDTAQNFFNALTSGEDEPESPP